ncbi:MAG: alpha/beta hydrolase [Hyphomonadaceae bacterium]|nr:alpha/beta hydrolase [Hyphomonadaceae bacterium]
MARLPVFLLAVSALAIAGCGPKAEVAPAQPPAPVFADEWYMFSAQPNGASPIGLNIHETKLGPQGRIWQSGKMYPVRNAVVSADAMSFIVPGLDISWSATRSADDKWTGSWTTKEGEVASIMGFTNPPDLDGKTFVTLADGRQMYLDCRGTGAPAVILDAGAGSTSAAWSPVHDEIAKTTLACAYDRAGHGLSDPGPLPLDTAAVANDIEAMLNAAGVEGPYVMVGHSLGSYHVRQFANTRFDKMAGMVLVDPSGDGQRARFAKAIPKLDAIQEKTRNEQKALNCVATMREKLVVHADPLFAKCGDGNDAERMEQTQSEVDAMEGASTEQLNESRRSYGDMPLIVLTRGDYVIGMPSEFTGADRDAMKKVWTEMHVEMTSLSTAGEHRVVPNAGHSIQRDQPQAVIDAVNEVVAKARELAVKP